MDIGKVKNFLLDKWWIFALAGIFLFAYWVRSVGNVPDRILSFDPTFFYRFTKYFADWGHFPVWDELSYYVGRADTPANSQLMWMITGTIYNFFRSSISLFTFASYMGAIYGALIIVPAFLLGRELSNKYGGIFAAALIGTAPQILVRTFGASYDTDQLALFFLLSTLYAGFRCLRKKTVESLASAIIVYSAAMLSWGMSMFTFAILCGYTILLFFIQWFLDRNKESTLRFSSALENLKLNVLLLSAILLFTQLVGMVTKTYDAIGSILAITAFAQKAEVWIVNVSIAELQPFNVFSLDGWIQAMGRFVTGDQILDTAVFLIFVSFMLFGIIYSYKKDIVRATFISAIFILAFYVTTRGIRFTEFSSALFLIMIAAGFGQLVDFIRSKSLLQKSAVYGLALAISFFALGLGSQLGYALGPDVDRDWDDAWNWIKTTTPEDSIIGTWWDPGHMISAYAERRNFADGAHCPNACKYTINDRIVDLGKIMATTDENISLQLIKKYQGTSSKVYWIASDDLIPKYQWLQYFGLGCDSRTDQKCSLYQVLPLKGQGTGEDGKLILRNYGSILLFETSPRIALYHQDGSAFFFKEVISQGKNGLTYIELDKNSAVQASTILEPVLKQLNLKNTNKTIDMTVWFPEDFGAVVAIPQNLRDTVFTKMFFLGGEGLNHFKPVYENPRVKIYEVVN